MKELDWWLWVKEKGKFSAVQVLFENEGGMDMLVF